MHTTMVALMSLVFFFTMPGPVSAKSPFRLIEELTRSVLALEGRTGQIENDVDNAATKDEVMTLKDLLTALESRVSVLENDVEALQNSVQSSLFTIRLDGDLSEQTIISNGDLSAFVQCRVNRGGVDQVSVNFTSTASGWFYANFEESANSVVQLRAIDASTGSRRHNGGGVTTTAISATGDVISLTTLAVGLNIFGNDCYAMGIVRTIPHSE